MRVGARQCEVCKVPEGSDAHSSAKPRADWFCHISNTNQVPNLAKNPGHCNWRPFMICLRPIELGWDMATSPNSYLP